MRSVFLAALLLLLATGLGALGAHALQPRLEAAGRAHAWETAVLYHLVHGLAILAAGIWQAADNRAGRSRAVRAAIVLWAAGIVAFSGSLYALALGAPDWIGPVTPLGGLCFLGGWAVLAVAALRLGKASAPAA